MTDVESPHHLSCVELLLFGVERRQRLSSSILIKGALFIIPALFHMLSFQFVSYLINELYYAQKILNHSILSCHLKLILIHSHIFVFYLIEECEPELKFCICGKAKERNTDTYRNLQSDWDSKPSRNLVPDRTHRLLTEITPDFQDF